MHDQKNLIYADRVSVLVPVDCFCPIYDNVLNCIRQIAILSGNGLGNSHKLTSL